MHANDQYSTATTFGSNEQPLEPVLPRPVSSPSRELESCQRYNCGLSIPKHFSGDQWTAVGSQKAAADNSSMWEWGDWYRYGKDKYPERLSIVRDPSWRGPKEKTLQNYAAVCRFYPPSRRREDLSFSLHKEFAGDPRADELLDRAAELARTGGKPSVRGFRKERKQCSVAVESSESTAGTPARAQPSAIDPPPNFIRGPEGLGPSNGALTDRRKHLRDQAKEVVICCVDAQRVASELGEHGAAKQFENATTCLDAAIALLHPTDDTFKEYASDGRAMDAAPITLDQRIGR